MWLELALLLLIVALSGLVAWRLRPKPALCQPQQYDAAPRPGTFAVRPLEAMPSIARETPVLEAQSAAWREAMTQAGLRLRRAGVRHVVFVHGTFVGHDPIQLLSALQGPLSALGPGFMPSLQRLSKLPSDRLLRDLGNYTPEYVSLFQKALGGDIPTTRFVWSSANNHVARLRAAVELLRLLATSELGRKRALLLGHSHGGQVLALLTQLVYPARTAEALWQAVRDAGEPTEVLQDMARTVARARLDIATFGMPPRYGWATGRQCRLLHVINHRGAEPRGNSLAGVLHTENGDYVHQWGISGSDIPPGSAKERELAARLDAILGEGHDVQAWLRHVRHGARVPRDGFSFLVDYGDRGSSALPNCLATCFGHGVYTSYDAMLFNARLLADHFYR
ncbi:hypothetical protein CYFUS_006501 [Cystobacter fuscus]|uniref:Alpha/beta hydrolase n=1 Tax=Cystobacter fuscus TaxID=43 RepID=A0A250JAV2_9BACT|nr:hypothetical protein [Cystobacter fuscus]ATB41039.1 hypothetical protein CYFUS_006501 [Cystobacter fuscus]